ncbi:SIMPL domain-containing protein [Christiangramia fulva]|uniref:SIMPL domain-containing protein n=1 Tax=Christiangramia fulva TaxID=2126553 RepID=A0A2R3Z9K1_9FLAO|nr:SIMPL domain-containing protein [Christiangramia fulva]AVR46930.1 SIMPL domain-containing protein [Christiangramia fulva]
MKKLVILLLLITAPLMAQENCQSTVNVVGEGVVKVKPDEVVIKSRIEHEGESAAAVKAENDKVVNAIIKYLKSQGIAEKDIETDYLNLNKRYIYNNNGQDRTEKFVANQAISITLHDITKYEKIMKGLLDNGMNRIDGIQFKSSEIEEYEKEARKIAVLNAKEIAGELANPLEQEVGKAVSINQVDYNQVQPMYRMDEAMEMKATGEQQTIAPGELEVKIRVNISFELK